MNKWHGDAGVEHEDGKLSGKASMVSSQKVALEALP
jgi:hypothetical protein